MKAEYTAKIHSGDYVEAEPIAVQLLAEHGISESQVDKTSPVYHSLCSGILRAKKKYFEHQQVRLAGDFSDDLEGVLDDCLPGATGVGQIPIPTTHPSLIKNSIALEDLAEAYEREKSKWSIAAKNDWKTNRSRSWARWWLVEPQKLKWQSILGSADRPCIGS